MRRGSWLLAAAAVLAAAGAAQARPAAAPPFVARSGTHLTLAGKPFRFGGANVEWLGLAGYGPADPAGPRYPTRFEVDDAFATARELGALVVRGQTLADSVGCELCLEPALGTFNDEAFAHVDYAIASARRHGLRLIATLVGDDARAGGGGCVYLRWRNVDAPSCSLSYMPSFWTDATVIGDVERHIAAVLNHVNRYTHVAYKNDPTILGWDLVNGGGSPHGWTRRVASFVRGLDRRHLILSGPDNAGLRAVDACVSFLYPHWSLPLAKVRPGIERCRRAGKPFVAYEYGWDRTNFPTLPSFRRFLGALRALPSLAGDAFWALQAHAPDHGWQAIPADSSDPETVLHGESGQWWALYYPGVSTLVTTAGDMAARAQAIREHDYALRGLRPPRHVAPPAPVVTSVANGRVYWRGSAGAKDYSIERRAGTTWRTVCRRCATDADDGWLDPQPMAGASYRVVPFGVDGRRGPASRPSS